jgi:predicted ATPase/DNA-binding CsgD family transcriptional regulator
LPLVEPLTDRELDILRLLADGLSNREIGLELALAPETVKWYNKHIFSKLGVRNRTEAANQAQSLGLLDHESPTESSSPELTSTKSYLPAQVTSFVGRQREIIEAKRLLENARLLTLTGPAGSGKTRLALQIATEVLPYFSDGVYFVPLAPLTDANNILWAIAERLDFQFHREGKALAQLLKYFEDKSLLLTLDNFEHLLQTAGTLTEILRHAPRVKILVTSRERLNLYGEVNYVVSGLHLPDEAATAQEAEAVELFLQRARSVNPHLDPDDGDLQSIARICHLVEGLPLAIELAATWVDVLSPHEIADEMRYNLDILETELRDAPYGQNSMRAAFDRSWNLLDDAQQQAFRRLSVFRGGFTRQAAEAVTQVNIRALQALVNKSLLRYEPESGRYEIHELLRQYAAEHLEQSGEARLVWNAYAAYFADFMAHCWSRMKGREQKIALQDVEADIENARAAWNYLLQKIEIVQLKKFFHSFWVFHDIRGWYPAGMELFERGVEAMRANPSEEAESALGWLLAARGLYSIAAGIHGDAGTRIGFDLAQQGVQVLQETNRPEEMIIPLMSLFIAASLSAKSDVASWAAQTCLDIATAIGDTWAEAKAKQLLALRAIENEDYENAERLANEALAVFDASGDNWSKSIICIEVLGLLATNLRQLDVAQEWIERGLRAAEEIEFKYSIQMAYWQLGFLAALQENYSESARCWHKALQVGERIVGAAVFIGFGGTSNSGEWGGRELIDQ